MPISDAWPSRRPGSWAWRPSLGSTLAAGPPLPLLLPLCLRVFWAGWEIKRCRVSERVDGAPAARSYLPFLASDVQTDARSCSPDLGRSADYLGVETGGFEAEVTCPTRDHGSQFVGPACSDRGRCVTHLVAAGPPVVFPVPLPHRGRPRNRRTPIPRGFRQPRPARSLRRGF